MKWILIVLALLISYIILFALCKSAKLRDSMFEDKEINGVNYKKDNL